MLIFSMSKKDDKPSVKPLFCLRNTNKTQAKQEIIDFMAENQGNINMKDIWFDYCFTVFKVLDAEDDYLITFDFSLFFKEEDEKFSIICKNGKLVDGKKEEVIKFIKIVTNFFYDKEIDILDVSNVKNLNSIEKFINLWINQ